ncbi:ATP-dependent RecD-like DNA helicase [Flavobacterium sp.]|uniref:ATP-dependent DNA helicase n=1 Tax=Flavobacterium sp. TaxID=239 RepID=UPI003751268A
MLINFLTDKYDLNQGQKKLVELLDKFLTSDESCFLLKGYAGTGKTFLMKGLTDYLKSIKREFRISAPTGRAAKVISKKTKHKAYTIHKSIYSSTDIVEYENVKEEGGETFKFFYNLRNNEDPTDTIYIVDESSMISDVYSEGEFFRFGSGHLLTDLVKFTAILNQSNRKIIFIGDDAQLTPYNCNYSPALSAEFLTTNFGFSIIENELTQVVRQADNSGILKNATTIRQAIKNNRFGQIVIDMQYQDTTETKLEDLKEKYFSVCNSPKDEETIIVAHSNNTVKEYNEFVRTHFFPNQPLITKDDKVIIVSNNYNQPIEVMNGDFGIIHEVSQIPYSRKVPLKKKLKNGSVIQKDITLTFREVKLILKDEHEKEHILTCNIIENLLYSNERDLSSDETKALYVDFKIRNPNLKAGTTELKDALRKDKYFNALRVKFGYAITCHKAQGGEWKNTFVNYKASMGYFNSSYFRWAYTATTRAKEHLYCINPPKFGVLGNVQPKIEIQYTEREDLFTLNKEVTEFEIPFSLDTENPFLQNIFYAVWEVIKDKEINLDKIVSHPFLQHYHFSDENNRVVFHINYNGKNKISSILLKSEKTEFAEKVNLFLQKIANKFIIIIGEESNVEQINEFEFPTDKQFLKEMFDKQTDLLKLSSIKIISIVHNNYNDEYKYSKNGLIATIIFDYKQNGRFTTKRPVPNKTTSTELLNEIISHLHNDN